MSAAENRAALENVSVMHDDEFGGVYIRYSAEKLRLLGITFGDSVDIEFSNGFTVKGLPYYSGYYNPAGEALLVAYPGYPFIKAAVNFGGDLWEIAGIGAGDTASVILAEKGKHLTVQTSRDIQYTDERGDYASDVVFANFRSVRAGNIKKDILYRSASPCDNKHNRAPYTDLLMARAGIRYILNLADNDEKIRQYMSEPGFASPKFSELYKNGCVLPAQMTMAYGTEDFRNRTALVLRAIAGHEGPYLVHCTEGKDRTGFILLLLEALCGAAYSEIEEDFMITYDNYYGIRRDSTPGKYDAIVNGIMYPMLYSIIGDESVDPATAGLCACAERYALDIGLDRSDIDRLRSNLTCTLAKDI